jgi:pimeloyl-ACP methyl ester carboxylesterase
MVSSTVFKNEMRFLSPALGIGLLLILIYLNATGCALVKLKQEVRESKSSSIIVGRVSVSAQVDGPIIVVAYTKDGGERAVAHHTVLHDWGEYELMVAEGNYFVFAFIDENRNLILNEDETAGQYGAPSVVAAPPYGVVPGIDIAIPPSSRPIDWPRGQEIAPDGPHNFHSRLAGEITDLDDERFAEENGSLGFWEGITFYKNFGGTIFFLEAYDPEKIPILFIHGAGGTPRGWKYFVEHIDRTRFQPWFFYYPSGARIRSTSNLLNWKLSNLRIKYKFDTLYITAHSMGGLVGRSFLMDYTGVNSIVKLFITLATPWGGVKMAEYGVEQSPAIIPCWIDMQPQGDFIQSIFRKRLPDTVSFFMFYGHRGSRNPFRSNNDGTITLASLLDRRPQAEAKMSYAFDEDHASILTSEAVLDQYNTIINAFYDNDRVPGTSSGGYLRVNFSYEYEYPGDVEKPWPRLILHADGSKEKVTTISLSPADDGKVLGPLPFGSYLASLMAEGVKSRKKSLPITIASDQPEELNFVLSPDGMLSGYVETAKNPENRVVGMPQWERQPEENEILLESVTLKGHGVHRTLEPLAEEGFDWFELETSRTDYLIRGYLRFFGLPAGQYELTIRAQGYKPYVTTQMVFPGKESAVRFFELTPE